MKLRSIKTYLSVILFLSGSALTQAASNIVLLDFGLDAPSWSTIKPNYWANSVYYNVVSASIAATSNGGAVGNHLSLQTSSGASSGITLTITDLFNGGAANGTYSPATAYSLLNISDLSSDDLYVYNSDPTAGFTLSGLSAGYTYKFTIFASRDGVSDIRSATYTLTGASTESMTLNASNNTSNVVISGFLSPTAGGTIDFSMAKAATNNNGSGYAYISGMEIEAIAVPEPGTWAMVFGGAGMLAFCQRIRRENRKL